MQRQSRETPRAHMVADSCTGGLPADAEGTDQKTAQTAPDSSPRPCHDGHTLKVDTCSLYNLRATQACACLEQPRAVIATTKAARGLAMDNCTVQHARA